VTWWWTLSSRLDSWLISSPKSRASGHHGVHGSSRRLAVNASTSLSLTSVFLIARSRSPRHRGSARAPPVQWTDWAHTAPAASATSTPRSPSEELPRRISRYVFCVGPSRRFYCASVSLSVCLLRACNSEGQKLRLLCHAKLRHNTQTGV